MSKEMITLACPRCRSRLENPSPDTWTCGYCFSTWHSFDEWYAEWEIKERPEAVLDGSTHAVIRNWDDGMAEIEPCTKEEARRTAYQECREGREVFIARLVAHWPGRNERKERAQAEMRGES